VVKLVDSLKKDIDNLRKSKEFNEYSKKHANSYLCAAFMIIESSKKTKWQIDYYCPGNDMITTFSLDPQIEMKESKILHRSDDSMNELNIENIDIGLEESLKLTSELKNKNYPQEKTSKIIIILQNINKKETWNITYLTSSFNVFNVNIDAQSGDVLKEKMENILNFKAQ